MREIRLRVGDGASKKVLGFEHFNTSLNNGYYYIDLRNPVDDGEGGETYICKTEFSEQPMLKPTDPMSRLLREQYTGLKDKNDIEIYEGDICKIAGSGNLLAIIDPLHGLCFGDYTVTYHDCMMENDEIEVIGNIYENPELLGE